MSDEGESLGTLLFVYSLMSRSDFEERHNPEDCTVSSGDKDHFVVHTSKPDGGEDTIVLMIDVPKANAVGIVLRKVRDCLQLVCEGYPVRPSIDLPHGSWARLI